jgi:hypothetical protein
MIAYNERAARARQCPLAGLKVDCRYMICTMNSIRCRVNVGLDLLLSVVEELGTEERCKGSDEFRLGANKRGGNDDVEL